MIQVKPLQGVNAGYITDLRVTGITSNLHLSIRVTPSALPVAWK